MRARLGFLRTAVGALLGFGSSCAAAHSRNCAPAGDQDRSYRVAYSKLSKDCWSGTAPELPAEVAIGIDALVVFRDGLATMTELVAKNCSAHLVLSSMATATGDRITLSATALDVRAAGSLHGAAELELQRGDGSSCAASLTLDLAPLARDAGF